MPSKPQDTILVAAHTLKIITAALIPTSSKESHIDPVVDGGAHSPPGKYGAESTSSDGSTVRLPNLMGRLKNWRRNDLDQTLENEHLLNRSRYESLIVFHPKNRLYPIYNLDAKLGERDGHSSIEFRCSASSDGESSFREITLEIGVLHLDKGRNPMKVIGFYPNVPQSRQIELQNLSAMDGGAGVLATVTFSGQNLEADSKVTWTWKVDDVLEDGLEDPCDFWVTIPPVEKGVKIDFKLTFRMRTNRTY